jgi:signal transduction histidine kinase
VLAGAQVASFARQTPLNAAVTISVSLLLALILWPEAPTGWLLLWLAAHQGIGWYSVWRNLRSRRRLRARGLLGPGTRTPPDRARSRRVATVSSVFAGLAWGSSALFMPVLPEVQQLAIIVVLAAMAGGTSTTLAAMPGAATAFVVCTLMPVAAYFALQARVEYLGLAVLSVVMCVAMVVASRLVYAVLRAELDSREKRLRLLEELRAAQHAWLAISRTTEAFALFDPDGRLQLWNDNLVRYLSLPADLQLPGLTHAQLLAMSSPCVDMPEFDARLLRLADHPDDTVVAQLANGRWLRSAARRTEDGAVVVVHVDITELKHAEAALQEREAELRQAQKLEAIGKLAGGVAHDFNNILTVIIGYTQLLQDAGTDAAQSREALEQIDRAAARAAALTRQLLAFGRKQQLQPEEVALDDILRDLQPLLARLLPASVVLEMHLGASDSRVRVDRQQMEQVLLNLTVNARDALPNGGHLRYATADAADGRVHLRVADDGEGMDAQTRERAFEPFYTTKPAGQGSGLGLASVYGFVSQSGGEITLTSEPGAGCTFDIHLPRAPAA